MDEENQGVDPNWKTPKAILDMPEMMPWEKPYVQAFYTLTSSRQSGMGLGAIPYSEMTNYCQFWDVADPELFIHIMQKCDNAYLEEYNRQQEAKNPKKGK